MSGKILVIDDETEVESKLIGLLISFGYSAFAIEDHAFLLKELDSSKPDLIIMDINMPITDGISLLIALKDSKRFKNIPVIMMTAHEEENTLSNCFENGAEDFLHKPFIPHVVKARVKSVLRNQEYLREIKKKNKAIAEQNKEIIEGIKYGQTIQQALFHNIESITAKTLPDSFVFFRPKLVVSGDFYWVKEANNRIYVAVADCTGHGVPGAFMSMLGYSLMNQIVVNEKETNPAEILNLLHENIYKSLKQEVSKSNDGMDMGLCVIDRAEGTIDFAGAYNLLFAVNTEGSSMISGSKFPIGGMHHRYKKDRNFEKKTIVLEPNTSYYLYTDGFPDQFGGENGRKFMKKYLHEHLAQHFDLPFSTQEQLLSDRLTEWKGDHPQIDDISVIGFRTGSK